MKLYVTLSSNLWYACLKLIIFCSINLQPIVIINASGNETDRAALLKFKESIDDDPYGSLSSWNQSSHFCEWYGIICSNQHQRVVVLDLEDHSLRGTLSPYIGNLSFLQVLNLQDNVFYGPIPKEVGFLSRLQQFYLANNTFAGEIPVSLSNCTKLRQIGFTRNNLSGLIPIELGSLMELRVLYLPLNRLVGGIPPSLGNLSSLANFSVAYNNLEGNIPDEIGQLKSLSAFMIASNNFSGTIPPSLYNISSITTISATVNKLTGTLPANLGLTLPNLRQFGIGGNQFFGTIPLSITNASALELFQITSNSFVGQVPTDLGKLKRLWWLGLSGNNLGRNSSGDLNFLTSLANCSNLNLLEFSVNNFGGPLPNSISNLSTGLGGIFINDNQIYGTIPESMENLIGLNALSMADNLFSGVVPSSFAKFRLMDGLALSGNRLSGPISFIGNLTRLNRLHLYQNHFDGRIPTSIENCQRLQDMDIAENNISGTIPYQVFGLSSLTLLLNVSHNSLNGPLPVDVGKLKNIRTLDFSGNNLSGEIPTSLGDCSSLEYLYMQGNYFQGNIPSNLASLKGLEHLDLSQNNLTGKIPEDLGELRLFYLNLSFNDLEGEVPSEGVFRNASAISFKGNSKLCGGAPEWGLPKCPTRVEQHGRSLAFKLIVTIIPTFLCLVLVLSLLVIYCLRKSKKPLPELLTMDKLLRVSYSMLHQATGGFSQNNLIGSGGTGSVYKAIIHGDQDQVPVAVKVLNLQQRGALKSFMAECKVLRNVRHRNLVKMLTYCSSLDYKGNDFKALIFEFMENSSLANWLYSDTATENASTSLDFPKRLNIAMDVASALHYLHDQCETPIVHCDLKPSNVLLDDDMVARVSDFGLARLIFHDQSSTTGLKGSIGYAAPEYGVGGEASKLGDVYSYGILVLEMLTGRSPTDEMFKDSLNLHEFVKQALPERVLQIVDPVLVPREAERSHYNDRQMIVVVQKCLVSMLEIGVACSSESPGDRMTMDDVDRQLKLIKKEFLSDGNARNRSNIIV